MAKKKGKQKAEKEDEEEGGESLDDAFADDDDVEYAESKPKKEKKKKKDDEIDDEIEEEVEEIEKLENSVEQGEYSIKASKPVNKVKKGDKIWVDGIEYEVDSHYVLIDHKTTKEMALEIFNPKTDKDYQLRYFDDQVERTLEFYELQEIMYVKRAFKKVEW